MIFLSVKRIISSSVFIFLCISIISYKFGVNESILGIMDLINANYGYIYGGHPVIVKTDIGEVEGFKSTKNGLSREGNEFYEFLGVPYAEPPIGNLRFEPPVTKKIWNGVLQTKGYASKCVQYDPFIQMLVGAEDCLYLNVYTPKLGKDVKLPVIVFIHGGLFMFGRAEMFRPEYMIDEDIVLVTIHYRLGALGFLNTGDNVVRGNMGLKDQLVALKWIQRNIEEFGGDPKSVTLLGESAGGASIHYHMMNPASKGLFHKAITMSGTALDHWAFINEPLLQAKLYAEKLNCPANKTTMEMISCLKALDIMKIADTYHSTGDRLAPRLDIFAPTVEAVKDQYTIVSESPRDLLEKGQLVSKVPWLGGVNSDEGLLYATAMLLNQTCVDKLNAEWLKHFPKLFNYEKDIRKDEKSKKIMEYYMGSTKFAYGTSILKKFVPLFTDTSFNIGLMETINYYKNLKHEKFYSYYYAYKAQNAIAQIYFNMGGKLPLSLDAILTNVWRKLRREIFGYIEEHYGTSHADELSMLFKFPYVLGQVNKKSKDYEFSKKFVKTWTYFAKHGNPPSINGIPNWPTVNGPIANISVMKIDDEFVLLQNSFPFLDRVKFWTINFPNTKYNL